MQFAIEAAVKTVRVHKAETAIAHTNVANVCVGFAIFVINDFDNALLSPSLVPPYTKTTNTSPFYHYCIRFSVCFMKFLWPWLL